jgi:hypothetical protein
VEIGRLTLIALLASVPVSAAVAAAVGGDPFMAAVGAALVLVYWALYAGFNALAQSGNASRAAVASAGGAVVRYAVIGGVLVTAASLDREGFLSCIVAFLALFTALLWARIGRGAAGAAGRRAS